VLVRLAAKSRVIRLTVDREPVLIRAKPLLKVAGVAVEPPPGAFVQAAAEAEAAMTAAAVEAIRKARAKRVADLFSGLGAFTFALSLSARVLAVDSDRAMVTALAAAARGATGLKPIEAKVRDLFRDPLSPRELDAFDAVIFDPPRAGAKAQAEALAASKVKTVVAVSCNPATLARDLRTLVDGGYRLERAVAIDQFLFTSHLEAVAVLSR
jgi:23S rRNA (uracil1939-C5)-methyltransferase